MLEVIYEMPGDRTADPNRIELGIDADRNPFYLDLKKLVEGRLLVQGMSGSGKSWLLRRLLEQADGKITRIVIDPDGEFRSLPNVIRLHNVQAARKLAVDTRKHRHSVTIDLSQADRITQAQVVGVFISALVEASAEQWHPALVAIDEASLFAPQAIDAVSKEHREAVLRSRFAIVDLMSRGRKRGLATVLTGLRLSRLSKSVVSEAQNFLIGMTDLDIDIKRAAELLGWPVQQASEILQALPPGHFAARGPAFSANKTVVRVGPIRGRHTGATPQLRIAR